MREGGGLEGFDAAFAGADAEDFVDLVDEDFAVADFACFGGVEEGLEDGGEEVVGDDDFEFGFWDEVDGVFAASIDFGVAALASEAFYFGDGHAVDADVA